MVNMIKNKYFIIGLGIFMIFFLIINHKVSLQRKENLKKSSAGQALENKLVNQNAQKPKHMDLDLLNMFETKKPNTIINQEQPADQKPKPKKSPQYEMPIRATVFPQ